MTLEWTQEETEQGVDHIAVFEDREGFERRMVVCPAELDGNEWYSLEDSDPDVLDIGDEDVLFSTSDAAKDYAQQLANVFLGLLPREAAGINYGPDGQKEWSPIPHAEEHQRTAVLVTHMSMN